MLPYIAAPWILWVTSSVAPGSNSILIVGGSNVAWPKEVTSFARPWKFCGSWEENSMKI